VDEESLRVKYLLSAHLLKQNHIHLKLFQIFTPCKDLNCSGNLGLTVGCHLAASPNSQSSPIMGPWLLPKLKKRILETSCPGFIGGTLACLPVSKGMESMFTLEARKEDLSRPGGGVPLFLSAHVQLTNWFPDQQSHVFSLFFVSTMLL
jgi:hypothetical protein